MRTLVPALALMVAACTGSATTVPATSGTPAPTPATTTGTSPPAAPTTPGTSPATSLLEELHPACFDPGVDASFVADGAAGMLGQDRGDGRRVTTIRITTPRPGPDAAPDESPTDCELVVVDLTTATGAPATRAGETRVDVLADVGIVRVLLPPEVTDSTIADTLLEGRLVERAYVVQQPDGALFVDLHLTGAAEVRAVGATRGQLELALRRRAAPFDGGPAVGTDAVIVTPTGPRARYPLSVTGYARSREPQLAVTLDFGEGTAPRALVTAAPHPWTTFETVFQSGPIGIVELTAGDARLPLIVE